jgi:hypothetical protein
VQFHAEALPGPLDTGFLFDEFVEKFKPRFARIDTNILNRPVTVKMLLLQVNII